MRELSLWAACLAVVAAADIGYVTDLDVYLQLAPCVSAAISYNVGDQTLSSRCPDGETAMQKCICSNTAVSKDVASKISTDVTYSCGTAATQDLQSASSVMDKYCNPDKTIAFSTPTANFVNAFITDLPQLTYLPPCAQSALSYAVIGENLSKCPTDAQLFAPCVCSKSGFPEAVSDAVSKSVRSSCSNNEDVTSAYNFYNEYCAMNQGTTKFAPPASPPGKMTYHITALPQFQSLRSCAQSGVSTAILGQTYSLCGSGPNALASCICLKSGILRRVSSTLTSNVKYYCDNTATADVTSALALLDFYCSAAEAKVTATVSQSVTESFPTTDVGTGTRTRSQTPPKTAQTTSVTSATGAPDTRNDGKSDGKPGGGVNKGAIIAAAVLGGVVAVAIVAAIVFFVRRKQRRRKAEQQSHTDMDGNSFLAKSGAAATVQANELHTPDHTQRPELGPGQGAGLAYSEPPTSHSPMSELQSSTASQHATPYGQSPQDQTNPGYGYHPSAPFQDHAVYEAPGAPVVPVPGHTVNQGN